MLHAPKKIDPNLKARAVRLVNEQRGEYSSSTAAAEVVAKHGPGRTRRADRSPTMLSPKPIDPTLARHLPLLEGMVAFADGADYGHCACVKETTG